jgi:hypothetical protein
MKCSIRYYPKKNIRTTTFEMKSLIGQSKLQYEIVLVYEIGFDGGMLFLPAAVGGLDVYDTTGQINAIQLLKSKTINDMNHNKINKIHRLKTYSIPNRVLA